MLESNKLKKTGENKMCRQSIFKELGIFFEIVIIIVESGFFSFFFFFLSHTNLGSNPSSQSTETPDSF